MNRTKKNKVIWMREGRSTEGNAKALGWKQLDPRTRAAGSWEQQHTVGIRAGDINQQGWAWVALALGECVGYGRLKLEGDI